MDKKEYEARCCMYDILVEVDRICKKNNIKYTLSNGTLIGAIKYKGFIPWDDDIDVAFLRDEYDKFIKCCENELNSEYRLVNAENEFGNPNLYHKIKIINTSYVEKISKDSNINHEIFLDLLPYDDLPNNYFLGFVHQLRISLYRRMLSIKCDIDFANNKNYLKRIANFILQMISTLYSKKRLIKKLKLLMTKYNGKKSNYVINTFGPYSYKKERMARSIFKDYEEANFEMGKFSIIKDYDSFLNNLYGDYLNTLPPLEERTSRHQIISINLGNYKIQNFIKDGK